MTAEIDSAGVDAWSARAKHSTNALRPSRLADFPESQLETSPPCCTFDLQV